MRTQWLQALGKHGKDSWLQAVQAIPHKLRSIYMHAAQSFIWNNAASERVRMHGLRVVEGDLVIPNGPWPDGGRAGEPLPAAPLAHDPPAEADGGAAKRRRKDGAKDKGDTAQVRIERAVRVTAADVESGKFSIEEVVLPLPGSDVEYPPCLVVPPAAAAASSKAPEVSPAGPAAAGAAAAEGAAEAGQAEAAPAAEEVGLAAADTVYAAIARRVGVSLTESPHSVKEFAITGLTGDYRRLVTVPRAMRMLFVEYEGLDKEILGGGVDLVAKWNPSQQRSAQRGSQLESGDHLPPPPPRPPLKADGDNTLPGPPQGQPPSSDSAPAAAADAAAGGEAEAVAAPAAAAASASPQAPGASVDGSHSSAAAVASGQGCGGTDVTACKDAEAEGKVWKLLEDACVVEDGKTVVQCAGGFREAAEGVDAGGGAEGAQGRPGRLGVVMTFALPASSYATMLTRELLKASTAVSTHKAASAAAAAGAAETCAPEAAAMGDGGEDGKGGTGDAAGDVEMGATGGEGNGGDEAVGNGAAAS